MDNIDHNPSARTAKDSFHGTAVSLTQHPSHDSPGKAQEVVVINPNISKRKGISDLPEGYTNIMMTYMHLRLTVKLRHKQI